MKTVEISPTYITKKLHERLDIATFHTLMFGFSFKDACRKFKEGNKGEEEKMASKQSTFFIQSQDTTVSMCFTSSSLNSNFFCPKVRLMRH